MNTTNNNYGTINRNEFKNSFPKLYDLINKYYPLGIRSFNDNYKDHKGFNELNKIILKKFRDKKQIEKNWINKVLNKIRESVNYEVNNSSFGFMPNYGGSIVLNKSADFRFSTKMVFFVSFIENFYSIQIILEDKSFTYKRKHLPDILGYGTPKVIVSPIKDLYGDLFNKLERIIKFEFSDALFIPFRFDITKLVGFETPLTVQSAFSTEISHAFFKKSFLLNSNTEIIGDIDYKISELAYSN